MIELILHSMAGMRSRGLAIDTIKMHPIAWDKLMEEIEGKYWWNPGIGLGLRAAGAKFMGLTVALDNSVPLSDIYLLCMEGDRPRLFDPNMDLL